MIKRIQDIQALLRSFLKNVIVAGDTVLDLTAGRGRDTLFLAQAVGPEGKVFAFDIQPEAIKATEQLLIDNEVHNRVDLYCIDHSKLSSVVNRPIKAAMLNLGYLPGGNTEIITEPQSTIKALKETLALLQPQGMIALTLYRGHQGGVQEAEEVCQMLSSLHKRGYSVLEGKYINQERISPYWVIVQKNRGEINES